MFNTVIAIIGVITGTICMAAIIAATIYSPLGGFLGLLIVFIVTSMVKGHKQPSSLDEPRK